MGRNGRRRERRWATTTLHRGREEGVTLHNGAKGDPEGKKAHTGEDGVAGREAARGAWERGGQRRGGVRWGDRRRAGERMVTVGRRRHWRGGDRGLETGSRLGQGGRDATGSNRRPRGARGPKARGREEARGKATRGKVVQKGSWVMRE